MCRDCQQDRIQSGGCLLVGLVNKTGYSHDRCLCVGLVNKTEYIYLNTPTFTVMPFTYTIIPYIHCNAIYIYIS